MFGKVEEPPASGSLSQKQIDSAVGGGGGEKRMLQLVWRERPEKKSCKAGCREC